MDRKDYTLTEPVAWKVKYDEPWDRRSRPGTEFPVHHQMTWNDEEWHIPSFYTCSKGLVIDVCVKVSMEKVIAFAAQCEETCTPEVRQKDPLDIGFHVLVTVNGQRIPLERGSGITYRPGDVWQGEWENSIESRQWMDHYKLDTACAWSLHRLAFPWATKRKPRTLRSLSVTFERNPATLPGVHFKNPSVGDIISFVHPVSGREHTLKVAAYEQKSFPRDAFQAEGYEFPTHYTAMTYIIFPHLSGMNLIVHDCLANEMARPSAERDTCDPQVVCVGIGGIGGADGPTAVVMGQPQSNQPIHVALSALHFEPTADVEWKIEFREKLWEDREVTLWCT